MAFVEVQDAARREIELLEEILDRETKQLARLDTISSTLSAILEILTPPLSATHGVITVQGGQMPGTLSVDTDGNAVYGFADDHGNATGPPPGDGSGIAVTFAVDNTALATVGPSSPSTDANGNATFTAQVVPVGPVGVINVSAATSNTSGVTPVLDADGQTTFVDAGPEAVTLVAGQAADGELSVDGA